MSTQAIPNNYFKVVDMPGSQFSCEYGYFTSCTGGDLSNEMIPFTSLVENAAGVLFLTKQRIPGQTAYSAINLSRELGSAPSQDFYDWYIEATTKFSKDALRNITIVAIDRKGKEQIRWHLFNALPTQLKGFSYNQYRGTSSRKFKVTLQAEYIELEYDF
jgi:phage tail-like protein